MALGGRPGLDPSDQGPSRRPHTAALCCCVWCASWCVSGYASTSTCRPKVPPHSRHQHSPSTSLSPQGQSSLHVSSTDALSHHAPLQYHTRPIRVPCASPVGSVGATLRAFPPQVPRARSIAQPPAPPVSQTTTGHRGVAGMSQSTPIGDWPPPRRGNGHMQTPRPGPEAPMGLSGDLSCSAGE